MRDISYIKYLQEWRESDHEDNIVLSRNDVCCLLDEIQDMEQEYENLKYHCEEWFK